MRAVAAGMVAAVMATQAGLAEAQAGCPVAADLTRGIKVDFADGSYEVFRSIAQGVIGVDGVDADGMEYRMELGQGLHLLSYSTYLDGVPDNQSRIAYDYGLLPDALPIPNAGGRWASPVTVSDQFGGRSEPQTHAWGPLMPVDIGGCSYDVIEVTIAYKTGDGYVENVQYIPDLGFGYLFWNESATLERYPVAAVAISVASKK